MRDLLINGFKTTLYKTISAGLKLVLVLLITNLFGADNYGAYTFAISVFLFLNTVFRFGFDIHLHKRIAEISDGFNKITSQKFFLRILLFTILILFFVSIVIKIGLPFFASLEFLNSKKYSYFNLLLIYSFVYAGFWLSVYYYRGLNKGILSVLILEILFPVLNILLILLLNYLEYKPEFVLINSFGYSVTICFISLLIIDNLKLSFIWKHRFILADKFICNEIKQSYPYLFISLSSMLLAWVDFYIISFFETDSQLGIYSVTTRVALFLLFPASAISIFFSNKYLKLLKNNKNEEIRKLFIQITKILFAISFSLFVFIAFFNKEILTLFGTEFVKGYKVLLILAFTHAVNASFGLIETILLMSDSKQILFKLNIITVGLNLIINIPLVYYYGLVGAAIGTFCVVMFNKVFQFYVINKRLIKIIDYKK